MYAFSYTHMHTHTQRAARTNAAHKRSARSAHTHAATVEFISQAKLFVSQAKLFVSQAKLYLSLIDSILSESRSCAKHAKAQQLSQISTFFNIF